MSIWVMGEILCPNFHKAFKVDENLFNYLIIQGDLGLEKACKAILAVCLQKLVYITWSHDQFCLQKAWHELYWAIYALNWL